MICYILFWFCFFFQASVVLNPAKTEAFVIHKAGICSITVNVPLDGPGRIAQKVCGLFPDRDRKAWTPIFVDILLHETVYNYIWILCFPIDHLRLVASHDRHDVSHRLYVKQLIQANNSENTIPSYCWLFVRWIHQRPVHSPHEGPVMRFHVRAPSYLMRISPAAKY